MNQFQIPVTVIIPGFNSEETIDRALLSILKQTKLPKEIIFIDDASSDKCSDIFQIRRQEFENKNIKTVFLKNEKNQGAGYSRNIAWDKASQKYIAFLDADDSWHPQKLEMQFHCMSQHPELLISAHRIKLYSGENKKINSFETSSRSFISLLFKTAGATPTLMVKREAPARFANFRTSEDRYLILSLTKLQKKLLIIEEVLAYVHKPFFGKAGLSHSLIQGLKGDQLLFNTLLHEKKINVFVWFLASLFNVGKLLKRIIPLQAHQH